MTRTRHIISLLLLLLATMHRAAAQPYCEYRTFNISDGLAGNVISGMAEDKNHLMWFASWNGLCYYDGYQFTSFRDMRGTDRILTTNRLLHLYAGERGHIWATTYDRRICMFNTQTCRFVDVSVLLKQKYGVDVTADHFMRGADGHTWALSSHGESLGVRMDADRLDQAEGLQLFRSSGRLLHGRSLQRVVVDPQKREWLLTDKGILTSDGKLSFSDTFFDAVALGKQFYFFSSDGRIALFDERSRHLATKRLGCKIREMYAWAGRYLVGATDRGVLVYDTRLSTSRFVSIQNPSQPEATVDEIHLDSHGRVWAFNKGAGVTMITLRTLQKQWLQTPPGQFIMDDIDILCHEDAGGTMWIIPRGGAFSYYDEHLHALIPYTFASTASVPSHAMKVRKINADGQHNLWIAGSHDLVLLNFKHRDFPFTSIDNHSEVRSLLTLSNGNLWIGTADGRIVVLDRRRRFLGYLSPEGTLSQSPVSFAPGKVMTFMQDRHKRIWIGTRKDGIYLIDGSRVRHFRADASDAYAPGSDEIFDFCQDSSGHIWVATWNSGINLIDEQTDGSIRFLTPRNVLREFPLKECYKVRRITQTRDGVMIASTCDGLVTFSSRFTDPSRIRFYRHSYDHADTTSIASADVLQTCVMRNGRIFVSTLGGDIQELKSKNLLQEHLQFSLVHQNAQHFKESMGIAMTEDKKGRLWIVHESDLSVFDPSTGSYAQYGPNYLGDHCEMTEAKPDVDTATGIVTVGTYGGIVSFRPDQLRKSNFAPRIVFTSVQYQGDTEETPLLYTPELRVSSDRRNFSINFAALDYANNYMVRYAYKLEGVDKEWNYLGNHVHSISYSHFPPGHYRLLVRSTNADGVWTDNVTTLRIYATPTFWETVWAKILYLLIAIGILYAMKRYYDMRSKTRTLHSRINQLLEEYSMRTETESQPKEDIYRLPPSEILDSDEQMMMKLMDFLSKNVGNSDLKMDDLADAVHLSRSVFYNKLKSKVGMTPVEFLKHIRIQKAEELITRSNESFSQIAYAVGFTDPKYFTKCFKKATGMTPSEYRSQTQQTEEEPKQ